VILSAIWVGVIPDASMKGRSVGNGERYGGSGPEAVVDASMKGRSVGNGEWVTILAAMTCDVSGASELFRARRS
jgi:hypothetical protein